MVSAQAMNNKIEEHCSMVAPTILTSIADKVDSTATLECVCGRAVLVHVVHIPRVHTRASIGTRAIIARRLPSHAPRTRMADSAHTLVARIVHPAAHGVPMARQ